MASPARRTRMRHRRTIRSSTKRRTSALALLVLSALTVLGLLYATQTRIPGRHVKPRLQMSGAIDFDRLFTATSSDRVGTRHARLTGGRSDRLAGRDVRGKIALARMTPGFDWLEAAKLGVAAVLFEASDEPWDYAAKMLRFPADLPRFLVQGEADSLVGRTVRIDCRVDWQTRETRNVIGVLRPKQPSGDAVVMLGFTDSWSVVPDLAPGAYEACSMTALVTLAEQRDGLTRTAVFAACSGQNMAAEGARRIIDTLGIRDEYEPTRALHQRLLAQAQRELAAMEAAASAPDDTLRDRRFALERVMHFAADLPMKGQWQGSPTPAT